MRADSRAIWTSGEPVSLLLRHRFDTLADAMRNHFGVVHGDRETVDALLVHPDVAAISFVGSTPVGEYIYKTGCANAKRVQALCGAKNHMVVMPDADLDQVVNDLTGAAFGSAGERRARRRPSLMRCEISNSARASSPPVAV